MGMGAGGAGSERIHPRQDKGDGNILNILGGSSGQDSEGETPWQGGGGEGAIVTGQSEGPWEHGECSPFW